VNDLSQISIGTDELVVLLSNLLDNAIEASCRIEGYRSIQCSVLLDETLFLSVRNTSNPVTIAGDTIPTSKTPKDEHGFGLSRIQLVLKQLNAEYTFIYENGWFEFVAEFPTPCK
jgi:sensor histidine kinase regulating citrate/malate metabolism